MYVRTSYVQTPVCDGHPVSISMTELCPQTQGNLPKKVILFL